MTAPMHQHPYGVGLAYRFSVHREALAHRDEIDVLEISTEDYIVRERRTYSDPDERLLREALAAVPCVAHGLSLSIGTVAAPDSVYLSATKRLMEEHGLEVFSEHLAFHSVDGKDLTMFLAMPFEEVSVQWLKHKYYAVRRALGRPFALENVTYHFPVPHGTLGEADFLRRLTEETDCTLLLDVTNVFNNSQNHGYDALEFLDRLPMERVSQMHLAGGHQMPDGRWEDSHSAAVMEPVWPLFEEAVQRAPGVEIVILERDSKLEPFSAVMDDIRKAREIFYRHRPAEHPGAEALAAVRSGGGAPPAGAAAAGEPDPLAPEFADLRAYQRSLMARITDEGFREAFRRDPAEAAARFGLSDPSWVRKLTDCDPVLVHRLEEAWECFREEDEQVAREYEQREWRAWADQLGGGF